MKPHYSTDFGTLYQGDCLDILKQLPDESVHCCVTSPPYWGLRDYGCDGQMGLEPSPDEYILKMVGVFHEVKRVLRDNGTLWVNIGDSYANDGKWGGSTGGKHVSSLHGKSGIGRGKVVTGLKQKDLIGIPWMLAFALRADGWYLRQDIIWEKKNTMPESVKDRCTKAHEYLFLLSKSAKYYYDFDAIKEKASPDSHARYARGRSNTHKWADGVPGDQTIAKSFAHMQKNESKGKTGYAHKKRKPGVNPKAENAPAGSRQNASFSAAVKDLVEYRNKRSVWSIPTKPYSGAHFATFPPDLIKPCIMAGCPSGGTVLDPFFGSGTTGLVAEKLNRRWVGSELNQEYCDLAADRIEQYSRQLKLFAVV